jgi:predicted ArsR family transcriptional regulator
MPMTSTGVKKAEILALIEEHGPLTSRACAPLVGLSYSCTNRHLHQMECLGQVRVDHLTQCHGSPQVHFGLPENAPPVPQVGGREYIFTRPTGTDPYTIDPLAV